MGSRTREDRRLRLLSAVCLALPETERTNCGAHADFRVRGKIFATLAYPDKTFAMVKLSLPDQLKFTQADKEAFALVPGFWGEHGSTHVRLKAAKKQLVQQALKAAWQHAAPKNLRQQMPAQDNP